MHTQPTLMDAWSSTHPNFSSARVDHFTPELHTDVICLDLSLCPLTLPPHLTICGMGERILQTRALLIHPHAFDPTADLRLKPDSVLASPSPLLVQQASSINDKISCVFIPEESYTSTFLAASVDAIATPSDIDFTDIKYQKFILHPSEFPPLTSSGITVAITHIDHFQVRKSFKPFNHQTTLSVSNVQRSFALRCHQEHLNLLTAYCYTDNNHFYHFIAQCMLNGTLTQHRISRSTTHLLVEDMIAHFKKI
jgi:hypothetical protein